MTTVGCSAYHNHLCIIQHGEANETTKISWCDQRLDLHKMNKGASYMLDKKRLAQACIMKVESFATHIP
jgi:hypothetical protein